MKTMKIVLPLLFSVTISVFSLAQNTDLPTPSSNLQILPQGSYVIPMDNNLQTDNVIGVGNFNLASYGLIVHLLNNQVKIKWVIKSGKLKDGIDFSGDAEQLKPVFIPGAISRNFIAGPFIIFASDTSGVATLVDQFYSSNSLLLNSRPKVFRLTTSVTNVDIRYDLSGFIPKAAVLTDGGKAPIQVNFMNLCKISGTNYMTAAAPELLTKCFTFASEPHNENIGATTNANISAIKRFVEYGGNFLGQCMAIPTYENNVLGRFQTTNGITVTNTAIGTNLSYPNADLSFSQFHGSFNGSLQGSCMNWTINPGALQNNAHHHATGTGANATKMAASVSKLRTGSGGLVFFLGNHDFQLSNGQAAYNGIRMYMNAFLTPTKINKDCSTGQLFSNPLPVKLISFSATLKNGIGDLKWITASEINTSHFTVEKSIDGINFTETGVVLAAGNSTLENKYSFIDNLISKNTTVIYYRLRMVDKDGKIEYSSVRIIRKEINNENNVKLLTYPNPFNNEIGISIPERWQGKKVTYEIINACGHLKAKINVANSSQTEKINTSKFSPGFYLVKVICNNEVATQKIIK